MEEEPVPQAVLTEEGKKPVRFFDAYPATNTVQYVLFAGGLLTVVVFFVIGYAFAHAPATPAPPPEPEWSAPVALLEIVDLSEAVLTGLASGRTGAAVYENEAINTRLMTLYGTKCATPWLGYAWSDEPNVKPLALPSGGRITGANVLSIAGVPRPLINARIAGRSNETTMVMVPFKFRSARNSRVISKHVTISHHDGVFATTDVDTAFCVQELYE